LESLTVTFRDNHCLAPLEAKDKASDLERNENRRYRNLDFHPKAVEPQASLTERIIAARGCGAACGASLSGPIYTPSLCSKNTAEGFAEFWRLHWDSLSVHKLTAMPLQ